MPEQQLLDDILTLVAGYFDCDKENITFNRNSDALHSTVKGMLVWQANRQNFTPKAIAERFGCTANTINNRIDLFHNAMEKDRALEHECLLLNKSVDRLAEGTEVGELLTEVGELLEEFKKQEIKAMFQKAPELDPKEVAKLYEDDFTSPNDALTVIKQIRDATAQSDADALDESERTSAEQRIGRKLGFKGNTMTTKYLTSTLSTLQQTSGRAK